jgi:hypothetical protein
LLVLLFVDNLNQEMNVDLFAQYNGFLSIDAQRRISQSREKMMLLARRKYGAKNVID